jgi:hypothetical protein
VVSRQNEAMEGMRVRVRSVDVHAQGVQAVVIAASHERTSGKPRARLILRLSLETVEGESVKGRIARVREEALRYLDVD